MGFQFDSVKAQELNKIKAAKEKEKKSKSNPSHYIKGLHRTQGIIRKNSDPGNGRKKSNSGKGPKKKRTEANPDANKTRTFPPNKRRKTKEDDWIRKLDFKMNSVWHDFQKKVLKQPRDKGQAIFGTNFNERDSFRRQKILPINLREACKLLLEQAGLLQNDRLTPRLPNILHSCPHGPRQAWHRDLQRSVLIALQDKTYLLAKVNGKSHKIALKAGEGVVFGKDFVHAGASYPESNTRLHIYLAEEQEEIMYDTGETEYPTENMALDKLPEYTPAKYTLGMY